MSGCVQAEVRYSDTDPWTWYVSDAAADVTVHGERTKQTACVLSFSANGDFERFIDREYALYRLDGGKWHRLEPLRATPKFNRGQTTLKPNEVMKRYYDWSYEYGKLPKGTYRLVTHWYEKQFTGSFGLAWEFTLSNKDDFPAEDYGYSGLDTDDVAMTAKKVSDHLWILTAEGSSYTRWSLEPSYAIYKLVGSSWIEVKPAVNLSPEFDQPRRQTRTGLEKTWIISLANIYPELEAGTYRFVKRTLKAADNDSVENWNFIPKENFSYVSAEFTLDKNITWKHFDTDPISWSDYIPNEFTYDGIETSVSNITPEGCDLHVKNNKRYRVNISYYFNLWRYDDGQWLPLAHKQYIANGLVAWTVAKESSAAQHVSWDFQYGSLEKGLYRLVAEADPKFADQKYITWDFCVS
jgi:hypothetical protein